MPKVTKKHWCWNCVNLNCNGGCDKYENIDDASLVWDCEGREVKGLFDDDEDERELCTEE